MQEEVGNNTYSGGPLSGLFRNCGCNNNNNNGCGCGDTSILFFLIIFLLLFTNCGCCNN